MQSIADGLISPGEQRWNTTIYFNGVLPLREPGFTFADDEGRVVGAFITFTHEHNQSPMQTEIFGDWRVFIQQTRDGKKHRKVTKYHWFKTKELAIEYIDRYLELAVARAKKISGKFRGDG